MPHSASQPTNNLGFMPGDSVVNCIGGYAYPDTEHHLVSLIRDLRDGEALWWAWCDDDHRMYQVSCGKAWVLDIRRTAWRGTIAWVWEGGKWEAYF